MKTTIYLIGTCFISTGIYQAALNSKNAAPGTLIAMGFWALFLWGCDRRRRKTAASRERQRLFNQWLHKMHRLN
jgi:hypothetical protein